MEQLVPSLREDKARLEYWATMARRSLSPGGMTKQILMNVDTDISDLLPLVQAPTIVMHGRDDRFIPIEHGRWMAERIPDARFIEFDGGDHLPYAALADPIADELEEFMTGARAPAEPDRRLATVLFSDVVDSTVMAASRGDRRWHELLDRHVQIVRRELERVRGREVKHTGDGFLAVFDGPRPGDPLAVRRSATPYERNRCAFGSESTPARSKYAATMLAASPYTSPPES